MHEVHKIQSGERDGIANNTDSSSSFIEMALYCIYKVSFLLTFVSLSCRPAKRTQGISTTTSRVKNLCWHQWTSVPSSRSTSPSSATLILSTQVSTPCSGEAENTAKQLNTADVCFFKTRYDFHLMNCIYGAVFSHAQSARGGGGWSCRIL